MGRFDRDNISGAKESGWKNLFLIPGKIIQWALYIGVSGKRYGQVRSQTRLARSPLMTYVYSFIAWFLFIIYCLVSVYDLLLGFYIRVF
jgi:hypothetical protein